MAEINASLLEKKIIFKKFKLKELLYTSPFNWVYKGKNILKNIPVAIKIEKNGEYSLLKSEAFILMNIKGVGFPEIISFGRYGPFKILIEELLGKSINDLWELGPFKKDVFGKNNTYIKDICLLAIQGLERIKFIHNKNIIHRDIKPKNFITGRKDPNVIYLIDFGFAKKYRSSRTGKHIRFTNLKMIYGSLGFASRYAIRGYESSRRDDLESFGYMLIYLAKGGWTPWMNYSKRNSDGENALDKIITKVRMELTDEKLCKGLPNEFVHYMKYVKNLGFEQEPNYEYLNSLFVSILSKKEISQNLTFFWIKQKPKKNEKILTINTGKNYLNNLTPNKYSKNDLRSNCVKRLYSKIKESLINNSSKKIISSTNYYKKNNGTNDTINKSENNINLHIQIFNTNANTNNINVNSTQRNSAYNNKSTEKIKFPKLKIDKIKYTPLLTLENITTKSNTKLNLKANYISSFQNNNKNINNKSNLNNISNKSININFKKSSNNSMKLTNYSSSQNKNLILYKRIKYNNCYSIKRNPKNTRNNFGIKKVNDEIKTITPGISLSELNLKKNILYRPIFKRFKNEYFIISKGN